MSTKHDLSIKELDSLLKKTSPSKVSIYRVDGIPNALKTQYVQNVTRELGDKMKRTNTVVVMIELS